MRSKNLSTLPPDLVHLIFQSVNSFADVLALARTQGTLYSIWIENAASISRAVLPRTITCHADAEALLTAQEQAESPNPYVDRQSTRSLSLFHPDRYSATLRFNRRLLSQIRIPSTDFDFLNHLELYLSYHEKGHSFSNMDRGFVRPQIVEYLTSAQTLAHGQEVMESKKPYTASYEGVILHNWRLLGLDRLVSHAAIFFVADDLTRFHSDNSNDQLPHRLSPVEDERFAHAYYQLWTYFTYTDITDGNQLRASFVANTDLKDLYGIAGITEWLRCTSSRTYRKLLGIDTGMDLSKCGNKRWNVEVAWLQDGYRQRRKEVGWEFDEGRFEDCGVFFARNTRDFEGLLVEEEGRARVVDADGDR